MVTKRGAEAAVLVPVEDWRRLQQSARPTLKELLLAEEPRVELPPPLLVISVRVLLFRVTAPVKVELQLFT